MMGRRRGYGSVIGLALVAAACNALTGADDLTVGAVPTDTAPGDGGSPTRGDADIVAADAGSPEDEDAGALPTCGASRVCVPAGAGWTAVVSPRVASSACQSDYATTANLVSSAAGGSCGCSCTPSQTVNCPAKATFSYGNLGTCTAGSITVDLNPDGGCTAPTFPAPYAAVTSLGKVNGDWTCTAQAVPSLPAPPAVRVCSGATATANGCGADELCAPAASTNARNCVIHDGDVSCPTGLSRRTVVGESPEDSRSCGACTCANDGCASGSVLGSSSTTCFGTALPLAQNVCDLTLHAGLKMLKGTGCGVQTPSQMTGAIKLAATKTLCCR
jgi:hypothetical protein